MDKFVDKLYNHWTTPQETMVELYSTGSNRSNTKFFSIMKYEQERVEEFFEQHELEGKPGFRLLDLVAEVGEVASDATKSADYGVSEEDLSVREDEIGDVLFSLLAFCNDLGIDAKEAFETSIQKYESRIEATGDPSSK